MEWCVEGETYGPIRLGPYQEQIRRFLLSETEFPENATINAVLSRLKTPTLAFSFPDTVRVEEGYCHRLHIPGISFMTVLGKRAADSTVPPGGLMLLLRGRLCSTTSSKPLLFVVAPLFCARARDAPKRQQALLKECIAHASITRPLKTNYIFRAARQFLNTQSFSTRYEFSFWVNEFGSKNLCRLLYKLIGVIVAALQLAILKQRDVRKWCFSSCTSANR